MHRQSCDSDICRMSSFFPLCILSLIPLLSSLPVEAKAARNHNLSLNSAFRSTKQAQRWYAELGLSPVLDANIVKHNTSVNASGIVETRFQFPQSIGSYETASPDVPNAENLGHYVGYYRLNNTKGAMMFYYFFESRKYDTTAPVVLWLSGGPGCSSSLALFYENGPFHLSNKLSLVWNEFGWDKESNLIYVDQPTGTGFSYSTSEDDIRSTSEEAAVDLYNFLQAFFARHPAYAKNKFYITGESYAGHYIPALAAEIQKNKNNRGIHINLQGMAIGNGMTNSAVQHKLYLDYAQKMHLINQTQRDSLNGIVSTCLQEIEDYCVGPDNATNCENAYNDCSLILDDIVDLNDSLNYYDIRRKCKGELCYDFSGMERFLNEASVKKALGVNEGIQFVSCSSKVYDEMLGDQMMNLAVYIPELLEDGIKVLIYAGEYDLICNWLGNFQWVNELEWKGQRGFLSASNATFIVNGSENAGWYKAHGPLTFLMVKNAGHLVPMDQPKVSLEMLRRWMKGEPL